MMPPMMQSMMQSMILGILKDIAMTAGRLVTHRVGSRRVAN